MVSFTIQQLLSSIDLQLYLKKRTLAQNQKYTINVFLWHPVLLRAFWRGRPITLDHPNWRSRPPVHSGKFQADSIHIKKKFVCKGQIISKWFFGVFDFLQKMNENQSTWGIIVVKSNSFVRFWRKSKTSKTLSKLSDL